MTTEKKNTMTSSSIIADEMLFALDNNLLQKWYPLAIDKECGGYFTNIAYDWVLEPDQDKMIVTQARHVWATAKIAGFLDNAAEYVKYSHQGFQFLKDAMWDVKYGGFYQIRNRGGGFTMFQGWRNEKRTYGNAFGLYSLAALYHLTHDKEVLEFAQTVFHWIEEHSFDQKDKGYYQFITREGKPFDRTSSYMTIASDENEVGYKDQNTSIHLLEAYTELYNEWKDDTLKIQLNGLLTLIRDTQVAEKGYLHLFFSPDWKPVSFRDASEIERKANYGLDHVSFGHDYETAFLMLEASFALGIKNDTRTLMIAKKMLDHALQFGFDESVGGFYDAGYYFAGVDHCSVIKDTKNWWAQAEGLNALLLFSSIFPEEKKYFDYFLKQWNYVKTYVLDNENGDWFEGGVDKEPQFKTGPKSHIWKCTYHTTRTLMNCITILREEKSIPVNSNLSHRKKEMDAFTAHWHHTGKNLQH
jgi:cellobiose epimerase